MKQALAAATHWKSPAEPIPPGCLHVGCGSLRLTGAAKHFIDLMRNHVLDGGAGRCQILTRIEMIRMLGKVFADLQPSMGDAHPRNRC